MALAAGPALAIGRDLPKDVLAMQGPNCVHGFMVNWEDVFFFAGDTVEVNKFLENYGKRDDLKRRVVIHPGTKKARSPWDQDDRNLPADWSYYIWNTARPDVNNPAPSQVDIWLGSRIKLDELQIPDTIEVVSGGEIEKFIEERSKKQTAAQPHSNDAQPAEQKSEE
jgi:hypothetical protein